MLTLIFMLILNSTSFNSSAIPFWDCTYALETDNQPQTFLHYSNNDSLYIMPYQYKYDSISTYFELFQLKPERKDIVIRLNNFRHPSNSMSDFIIKNNTIFSIDLFNLYIYKFENNKFQEKDSLSFNKFLDNICYESGKLYLSSCLHSPKHNIKDSAANLFIVDLENLNEYIEINFPSPKGILYTSLQPRKLMDYKYQRVAIGDAIDYRILIYNLDGHVIDSVKRDLGCFMSNESLEEAKRQSRYDLIENFSKRCMISQVNFIDDRTLLVSYQAPPVDDTYYTTYHDIWRKNQAEWKLDEKDLYWKYLDSATKFHPMNFGLHSRYFVNDNIISLISHEIPFPLNDDFYKMTMGEFKDSTDRFFPEKNWGFSIIRHKIEVDNEE